MSASRSRALSYYRSILRAARAMPTANRVAFVRRKARDEFEAGRAATGEQAEFLFKYAEISIENIEVQARHLRERSLWAR
jgi:hypothetical protein